MLRPATEPERARILAAIPAAARAERFHGAAASVLLEDGASLLDGVVRLSDPATAWVRPLALGDAAGLDACLALLDRRRAQVVHDASGPAMGVLAALETVLEYEPIEASTRALVEESRAGLLRLIKRLGDRSGALAQRPNVVGGPLRGLIERIAAPALDAIDSQGRLRIEVEAADTEARLDAAFLEGVLGTLLSNAWASRRGQEASVLVEAALDEGLLRVSVSDDGRGITEETLLRAGELGFTHRPNGVGIGLFHLRRALARRSGVFLIQALPAGTCATVFASPNASPTGA